MSGLPSRAFPVVLAAPSGTGKTTIAHALVRGPGRFVFSVSATTRPPRGNEQLGKAYDFLDEAVFRRMVEEGEFVEWARVHGHLYGTPRANLEMAADRGEHVVLDIDVQGARQIRASVPEAVLVFVFPPSAEDLVTRLQGRGTETTPEMRRRLRAAGEELEQAALFDYIVVNDDLDRAVSEVRRIVEAESMRPSRIRKLPAEVERLRQEIDRFLAEDPGGE